MQVVWELDNLEQLGGNKLDVSGRPAVIAGPYGPAIEFGGVRGAGCVVYRDQSPRWAGGFYH